MSLQNTGISKGITLVNTTGSVQVYIEHFAGTAPSNSYGNDGDYAIDSSTNEIYLKTSGVWDQTGISSRVTSAQAGIRFRNGGAAAYTTNNVSALSGVGPHTLNGISITFSVGDKVISGFDNNVYQVNAGAWTIAVYTPSLADNDAFFVSRSLPDTTFQTGLAIYQRISSIWTKIADIDFETANTIGFSSYTPPASGVVTDVTGADSVQDAIGKLDTSVDNLISVNGVTRTSIDLGTFTTGSGWINNLSIKNAFETILTNVRYKTTLTNITTSTVLDSVAFASFKCIIWDIEITRNGTPSQRRYSHIAVTTDGTTINHTESNIVRIGTNITGVSTDVDLLGVNVRLLVSASVGIDAIAVRKTVV